MNLSIARHAYSLLPLLAALLFAQSSFAVTAHVDGQELVAMSASDVNRELAREAERRLGRVVPARPMLQASRMAAVQRYVSDFFQTIWQVLSSIRSVVQPHLDAEARAVVFDPVNNAMADSMLLHAANRIAMPELNRMRFHTHVLRELGDPAPHPTPDLAIEAGLQRRHVPHLITGNARYPQLWRDLAEMHSRLAPEQRRNRTVYVLGTGLSLLPNFGVSLPQVHELFVFLDASDQVILVDRSPYIEDAVRLSRYDYHTTRRLIDHALNFSTEDIAEQNLAYLRAIPPELRAVMNLVFGQSLLQSVTMMSAMNLASNPGPTMTAYQRMLTAMLERIPSELPASIRTIRSSFVDLHIPEGSAHIILATHSLYYAFEHSNADEQRQIMLRILSGLAVGGTLYICGETMHYFEALLALQADAYRVRYLPVTTLQSSSWEGNVATLFLDGNSPYKTTADIFAITRIK